MIQESKELKQKLQQAIDDCYSSAAAIRSRATSVVGEESKSKEPISISRVVAVSQRALPSSARSEASDIKAIAKASSDQSQRVGAVLHAA